MMARWDALQLPDIEKMRLNPEEYLSAGVISPEEYQLIATLNNTALENIQTDPRLRQDQMTALDQTRQRALEGFNDQDRAMLDQYMRQMTSTAQSQKQSILEDAARRGTGGSGASLAAALQGNQGAANAASSQAMQQAAMRLQNQTQNSNLLAQLAGQIEGTDYSRAAEVARRKDAMDEFNQRLRQDVTSQNVALRNQAQAANLQNKQALMSQNTALRNQNQERNANLLQQDFANRTTKLGGMQGQAANVSNLLNQQGQATANMWSGIGNAIGSGFAAYGMYNKKSDGSDSSGSGGGGTSSKRT
jgi:hypothetical protein